MVRVVRVLRMRGDNVGRGNVSRLVVVRDLRLDELCREARDVPRPAKLIIYIICAIQNNVMVCTSWFHVVLHMRSSNLYDSELVHLLSSCSTCLINLN